MFYPKKLQKFQESVVEEALEPELEIIDPHIHLWHFRTEPKGALSTVAKVAHNLPPMIATAMFTRLLPIKFKHAFSYNNHAFIEHGLDEYVAGFGGHNVTKTVVIESGWENPKAERELQQLGESIKARERLERLNARDEFKDFRMKVVPYIDLRVGKEKVLAAFKAHVEANENVVGIRNQLAFDKNPAIYDATNAIANLVDDEGFRDGVLALVEQNIPLDTWVHHHQLEQLAKFAADFSDLTIILNHIGTPLGVAEYATKVDEVKKIWEAGLKQVAANKNVLVKVSGFGMPIMGFGWADRKIAPTSDEVVEAIFPYVETVIGLFGVERCMFASNFPVDKASMNFGILYNAFKKCCNKLGLSEAEKNMMFYDNASKTYKF